VGPDDRGRHDQNDRIGAAQGRVQDGVGRRVDHDAIEIGGRTAQDAGNVLGRAGGGREQHAEAAGHGQRRGVQRALDCVAVAPRARCGRVDAETSRRPPAEIAVDERGRGVPGERMREV
jgi:hypothetical protein